MKTVLITGASEGLGLEFVRLFARKDFNLILVARNETKLQKIAKELCSDKISILIYAKDLSILENAEFIYNDLTEKDISVSYLINNAGFGINSKYINSCWDAEYQMYNLNMITLAYFTQIFAKDMTSRNFGRILNIGSTASFQPGPFMAGYCATKAFVLSLSEAVNNELKGTNVRVSTLCPGITDTQFHTVARTETSKLSKLLPHASAKEVAEYGFSIMMKGKSVGIHHLFNKLMIFSVRFTPRSIVTAMSGKLMMPGVQSIIENR